MYVKRRQVSDRCSQTKGGGSYVKSRAMSRVCMRVGAEQAEGFRRSHTSRRFAAPRPEELMDAAPPCSWSAPPPPRGSRVQPIPPDGRWALRCHAAAAERAPASVTRGCGLPQPCRCDSRPSAPSPFLLLQSMCTYACRAFVESRSCDFAFSRWDGVFMVSYSNRWNVS